MSITTGTTVYRANYYGTQTGIVIGVVGTDAVVSWTNGGRNELVALQDLRTEPIAPITIDTTPAGIFAAMMRANASESAAPQSRLYGLLSDYLRRTLAATYGTVAAEHIYQTAMSSGEFNDETIPYALESVQYSRTELVPVRDLHTGDTVDTDMGPVLLVKDNGARGLLDVRNFTGRILSIHSVPEQNVWILRSNVGTGHSEDYWAVQGAGCRLFRRYV